MTNTNFLQCGEVTACGHCQPDKYGEGLKQAIAGGFDETKCECKCHKPMTNTTWKQQFEYDFRTKVFKGMSREETTQEAVKYFTRFFEKEIKMARNDMKQRIQYIIDDNDDYIHFIEQFKQL